MARFSDEVVSLRANAVGYVWGMWDSGNPEARIKHPEVNPDWHFAEAYAEHSQLYADGVTYSRTSVQDAWKSWRKHGLIFDGWHMFEPAEPVE